MEINDFYNITEDWNRVKELIQKTDRDIELFTSIDSYRASVRARNNLNEIRKICIEMRAKVLKQRQDGDSDYS